MALFLAPRFGSFFDDFDAFGSVGPQIHVRESPDALFLELEVPRYRAEELKVEVQGTYLAITGDRAPGNEHRAYNQFLYGEAPMSHFRRVVNIPADWDVTKVAYELNYGVLQVRIPRAPAPVPPPPPQVLPIAGAPAASHGAVASVTDKRGLQVTSTSSPSEYNAVATMKWPPKIKVDDANDHITYTATMPPTIDKDHMELSLDGRNLRLGVNHRRSVVKKDDKGNTVYNQTQSVSYSTNLLVPEGTQPGDISTNYADGQLTINVSKHANPTQNVPVTKAQ